MTAQFDHVMQESARASTDRAQEIAGCGSYDRILEDLSREGLLEEEILRTKECFGERLGSFPEMDRSTLEGLTAMRLFDHGTAEHCVATYEIAEEKITRPLAGGVRLSECFEREGILPRTFYSAALLHDIGKITLPRFLITLPYDEAAMTAVLHRALVAEGNEEILSRIGIPGESPNADDAEVDAYMREHHLRAVGVVPVDRYLAPHELAEVLRCGFDGSMTLTEIIRTHERASEAILGAAGYGAAAELAGSHHNYDHKTSRYPITVGSLHISVDLAELLHIADVEQALLAGRSYKRRMSRSKALSIIVDQVSDGMVSPEAAYLWLRDELEGEGAPIGPETQEDVESLSRVRRFVDEEAKQLAAGL